MKQPKKKLSVTIDPEIDKILEDGGFNKSKLINKLLEVYIKSKRK
jgi:hypothetical protein